MLFASMLHLTYFVLRCIVFCVESSQTNVTRLTIWQGFESVPCKYECCFNCQFQKFDSQFKLLNYLLWTTFFKRGFHCVVLLLEYEILYCSAWYWILHHLSIVISFTFLISNTSTEKQKSITLIFVWFECDKVGDIIENNDISPTNKIVHFLWLSPST